ncbi:protein kinase [Actinocorallia sp. B10E7]|uniref:protein kinase domain-containing protein n=1 Tax=Actinocorallia sp. B10E7 TaxID=3153558 RepID=UPI00325CADFD
MSVEVSVRVLAGRYALEEELGRGGMGVVYRATDLELGRDVAVKLLPEQFSKQPGFLARFQREARVAAGLSHPHVAVVHDIGQDGDAPYLVMELVAGRTMSEAAGGAAMEPEHVASVAVDVLDALEHCHARGIVHRDIKPSNIMLDEAGVRPRVKVMDFGIARLLSDTATRLTATGMLIGTPAYLSPEQANGEDALPASDLYSLGCVLYELLTGRPPFTGDSPTVVLLGHLQRTPQPPSALRPGLAPEWDRIVMTALAKAPEERFASATAMRDALQALLVPTRAPMPVDTGPPSPTDLLPPIPLYPPAHVPPGGGHRLAMTGPDTRSNTAEHPSGVPDTVWTFFAGIGLLFAMAAGAVFVVATEGRGFVLPQAYLAYLLLIAVAGAMVVPPIRQPAAALLAGTLPTWPFWIIWESFRASPDQLWLVSYSCGLAMAVAGGAVALGSGLTPHRLHPFRLVWSVFGSLAAVALTTLLLDFHERLFAPVVVACVVTALVITGSAFLRSPWATAATAVGWLAAVPLYGHLMLG